MEAVGTGGDDNETTQTVTMGRTMNAIMLRVAVTMAATLLLASCGGGGDEQGPGGGGEIEVAISGAIDHAVHTAGQTGTVTFSRFPATVGEFRAVRERIGGEPHGAVALQIMAYELYRRNRSVGEECIRLNNATTNVTVALDRLKEIFGGDAYYARPYQMAAFLKGASWDNGYAPSKPYTVEVRVHAVNGYDESSVYQAKVLRLEVLTKGKDSGREGVDVVMTAKPGETSGNRYFIVDNSPGLYSQVREISFTTPFEGLD